MQAPGKWWLLALLLAALQSSLLVSAASAKSDTWDETFYIVSGASQVARREMSMNPVPAWGFGAALAAAGVLGDVPHKWETDGTRYVLESPERDSRLFAARMATVVMMVLAGFFVWRAASRAGPVPAALAHASWCFAPSLVGNGALATLDPWEAALLAIGLWGAIRWRESPSWRWSAFVGAMVALASGCKVTALGAGVVFVVIVLVRVKTRAQRIAQLGAFAGVFLLVIWAACAFEIGRVEYDRDGFTFLTGPLPFPLWIRQIVAQGHHGFVVGHVNAFDGAVSRSGWWTYYLAALAYQIPLATQVLGAVALFAWLRRWNERSARFTGVALLAYPVLLVVVMSAGKTQLGLRYLLPAAPFVAVWLAFALERASTKVPVYLVVAAALSTASLDPDYLTYFNVWAGGPGAGYRHIVEGVDWCQDRKQLAGWMADNGVPWVYYTECGPSSESWGIRMRPTHCVPGAPGIYALHPLIIQSGRANGCFDWLTSSQEPDLRLGRTIEIYEVGNRWHPHGVKAREIPLATWLFEIERGLFRLFLACVCAGMLRRLWRSIRGPRGPSLDPPPPDPWPSVTVQLPMRDEGDVVERVLRAAVALDYPREQLEIQVLDDSERPDVRARLDALVTELAAEGHPVTLERRGTRTGFKGGNLAFGHARAGGELIAVFDTDAVPQPDFLRRTVPHLTADPRVGLVQTRQTFRNRDASLLTRVQALLLDALMLVEQPGQSARGRPLHSNGSAGVWRRACIDDAGGWQPDVSAEDLYLSHRAALRGWRFVHLTGVAVESELPETMAVFRLQQERWTRGKVESLRRVASAVARSNQPLGHRADILLPVASRLLFPFLLVLALTMPLTTFDLIATPVHYTVIDDAAVLAAVTACSALYYARAASLAGRRAVEGVLLTPVLVALMLGLSLSGAIAWLRALAGEVSSFVPTPKRGDRPGRVAPLERALAVLEVVTGGAYGIFTFVAITRTLWSAAAFFAFVAGAWLWVGGASLAPSRRAIRRLSLAAIALLFAWAAATLARSPVLGVADNGDYHRVAIPAGLVQPASDARDARFVTPVYGKAAPAWGYHATSAALIPTLASVLTPGRTCDLREIGLAYLALLAVMIAGAWRLGVPPPLLVAVTWVLVDPGYLLLFNSLYGDPPVLVALVGIAALLAWPDLVAARGRRAALAWGALVALALFAGLAKVQYAFVPALVLAVVYARVRLRPAIAAGALVAALACPLHFTAGSGPNYPTDNAYSVVFNGVAVLASDPDAALAELGIPGLYRRFAGRTRYEEPPPPALDETVRGIPRWRVAWFYAHDPPAAERLLATIADGFGAPTTTNLGNFEQRERPAKDRFDVAWQASEALRAILATWPWLLWAVLVGILVGVASRVRRHGLEPHTTALAFLWCFTVSTVVIAALGDGVFSLLRHVLAARLAFSLMLLVAIDGLARLAAARMRRSRAA